MKYIFFYLLLLFSGNLHSQDTSFVWRTIQVVSQDISLDSNISTILEISTPKSSSEYKLISGTFSGANSIHIESGNEIIIALTFYYDTTYKFDGSVINFEENVFKRQGTKWSKPISGITQNCVSWQDNETRFTIIEEIGESSYRLYSKLENIIN